MDYCLGDGDGSATMWTAEPDLDLDGDGRLDAVGLDFDGDDRLDDAMADLDGDALAEHAVLDLDDDDHPEAYFTDDGSGTWLVSVDRTGQVRWFGLDGLERFGGQERSDPGITGAGPTVDFDADGQVDDRLVDIDGNGLADRVLSGESPASGRYLQAYVDTDGDGRWDVKLVDSDGDGTADAADDI